MRLFCIPAVLEIIVCNRGLIKASVVSCFHNLHSTTYFEMHFPGLVLSLSLSSSEMLCICTFNLCHRKQNGISAFSASSAHLACNTSVFMELHPLTAKWRFFFFFGGGGGGAV